MINLKIDPEFQSQIPPLTDDEFKQLEENILKEGKLLSLIHILQQYGIAVKESRGQLSYLPAGRTKFIRAKHLGDNYDKAYKSGHYLSVSHPQTFGTPMSVKTKVSISHLPYQEWHSTHLAQRHTHETPYH